MKLWHDDIREPPDDTWTWARTNEEAMSLLHEHGCTECSLDHDLGLHILDPKMIDHPDILRGEGSATGYDLVEWMIIDDVVPPKIRIHSWNPDGAMRMARLLADHGHDVLIDPFHPSWRSPR